jgi:glycosyltransferase involved in cell wall biosynthesis
LIGYIGRIVPEKGVETLIEAFLKIPTCIQVSLVIVGDGDDLYKKKLRMLSLGNEHVIFVGKSGSPELYHQAFDILCVPSEWDEVFPMVIVEAMACGLPVVCTNVGILSSIIGEDFADCVVPPFNPELLREAIVRVLLSTDILERASILRERGNRFFSAEIVVSRYVEVLEMCKF